MENFAGLTIVGDAYDGLGSSATIIGDINGDGFDDLAVQGPGVRYEGGIDGTVRINGAVYVIFGGDDLPPVIDVEDLDGTAGFTIRPDVSLSRFSFFQSGYDFGRQITAVGDVNGDGIDDFAIGQYSSAEITNYYGNTYYGDAAVAHVILGGQDWQAIEQVEDLAGFRIDALGRLRDIISLGDINGDGFAEVGLNTSISAGNAPELVDFDYYYLYDADGNGTYNQYLDDGTTPSGDRLQQGTLTLLSQPDFSYVVFGTDQARETDDALATGAGFGDQGPNGPITNVVSIPDDAPTTSETIVNTAEFSLDGDGFAVETGNSLRQLEGGDFSYGSLNDFFFYQDGGIEAAGDLNGDGNAEIGVFVGGEDTDVLAANNGQYRVIRTVVDDGNGGTDVVTTITPENPDIFTFVSNFVILGEDRDTSAIPALIDLNSAELDLNGTLPGTPDSPGAAIGDVTNDGRDDIAIVISRPGQDGVPDDPNDPDDVPVPAVDTVNGVTIVPGNADGNPFAPFTPNFITDTSNIVGGGRVIIGPVPQAIEGDGVSAMTDEPIRYDSQTVGFSLNGFYGGSVIDGLGDVNGDGIDDFVIVSQGSGFYGNYYDVANVAEIPEGTTVGYVIFGQDGGFVGDIDLKDSFGDTVLAEDRLAFKVIGIDQALGPRTEGSGGGDIDGDGFDDILFNAAPYFGEIGPRSPGGARVLFGGLDSLAEIDAFDGLEDGVIDIRNTGLGIELSIDNSGFFSQFRNEGDDGPTLFEFTVFRTGDLAIPVSVDFEVRPSGFDPADLDDFVQADPANALFPTGTVDFVAGEDSATITIEIQGDRVIENSEDFTVTLSNPVAGGGVPISIVGDTTSARIFNDDQPVRIFARNASVTEGNEEADGRVLAFEIDRSGEDNVEVTVTYEVLANSADADDFEPGALVAASGVQVLTIGQNTAVVEIPIAEDVTIEGNENVRLNIISAELSGASVDEEVEVIISDGLAFGTILNDDFPPQVLVTQIGSSFQQEGTGPGNGAVFNFQIQRRGVDDDDTTVTFDINGLASPGGLPAFDAADIESVVVDGVAVSVTSLPLTGLEVEFTGNESAKDVVVTISPDADIEPRETFEVRLTQVESLNELPYQIFSTSSVARVNNDDGRPPVIPPGVEADVFGDPHIVTLDGLGYDFQAVGEYILVETQDGATNPFQVQVRFEPLPGSDLVSVTTRMAVEVNGVVIEMDALGPDTLLFDGVPAVGVDATLDLPDGAGGTTPVDFTLFDADGDGTQDVFLNQATGEYFIVLNEVGTDADGNPINELLAVKAMDGSLNICVFLSDEPDGNANNVRGLMGDADGDLTDDFQLRDGTAIPADELTADAVGTPALSFDFLYSRGEFADGGYANSWRVNDLERDFSDTAPAFPDGFPIGVLTLADLPEDLRLQAEAAALAAGLDPNEPAIFDAAVLDFALTGDDDFLQGALGLAADPEVNTTPEETPDLPLIVGVNSTTLGVDVFEGGVNVDGTPEQTGVEFNFYRIGDTADELVITYQVNGDVDDDDILVDADNPGVGEDRTVTLAAGADSVTDIVVFEGDLDTEDDEQLAVSITGISDPAAMIGSATASVLLLTDDMPPEATDNEYTTDEDTEVFGNLLSDDTGAGLDSDPENDPLSVVAIDGIARPLDGGAITLASGATIVIAADGAFTYNPFGDPDDPTDTTFDALGLDGVGEDIFTYTISDGNGGLDTATVTIGVTGLNDAPVAVDDDGFEVDFEQSLSLSVEELLSNDSDPDGDDLIDIVLGTATGGTVSIDAIGDVVFEAEQDFSGEATFEYIAVDLNGAQSQEAATVTINVLAPPNVVPEATDDEFTTTEGDTITGKNLLIDDNGNGVDFDPDGDILSISAAFGPNGEVLELTNGNTITGAGGEELGVVAIGTDGAFFFDPAGNYESLGVGEEATLTLTVSVSDGELSAPSTVSITITGENDAPVITSPDAFTVTEEQPFAAQITAEDVDDADLTFEIVGGDNEDLFELSQDGILTFAGSDDAPDVDAAGGTDQTFEVEVQVADDSETNDRQLIQVTVENDIADDDPDDPTVVVGGDGTDFQTGTGGDDTFLPGGGFVDLVDLRAGGADTIVFGDETDNGSREFDYILGFGADDKLDLGDATIGTELNFFGRTFLYLDGNGDAPGNGDGDVIVLFGVSDFDETTQVL